MEIVLNLKRDVIGTLVGNSTESTQVGLRDLAERWWTDIERTLSHRPYHNLKLVAKSLALVPPSLKSHYLYPLMVTAFALQWTGPSDPRSPYLRYRLRKVLKWPEQEAGMIGDLAEVRLNLEIPALMPYGIMYDINMARLAFPENEFHEGQRFCALGKSPSLSLEKFDERRRNLFQFLRARGRIFATTQMREEYENRVHRNLTAFLATKPTTKEEEKITLTS